MAVATAKVVELQAQGRPVAMVGAVSTTAALAQTDVSITSGAGTDVAVKKADVVLMRSSPLDFPRATTIARAPRKTNQNLLWG